MSKYYKYLTIAFIVCVLFLIAFFWKNNLELLNDQTNTESSSSQTEVQLEVNGTPRNNVETNSSTEIQMEVYDSSK